MNEMLSYVYARIWKAENAARRANDMLSKQTKRNQHMKSILAVVTLYAAISELRNANQKERIKELKQEIEELKRPEGE